jgi:dTDP-4-dehydrorhamnose 3,5-epimerase
MIFRETAIEAVWVIEPERYDDERGFFARTWDTLEFAAQGLTGKHVQSSISFNRRQGTLRGLHYQAPPREETKLVRCTAGAVFDVAVDLRPDSATYCTWVGVELSEENRLAIYVPEGCAHGFLTLADETEIEYQMSEFHAPDASRGVRFDDAAFGIAWPEDVVVINERDRTYPDFAPGERGS